MDDLNGEWIMPLTKEVQVAYLLAKKTRLKSEMYVYIDKCSVFVLKDEFTRTKGWAVCEHDIESPLKDFVGKLRVEI